VTLSVGEPAPMFIAPSKINPKFAMASLGGRYILLAFLPPPGPARAAALGLVAGALGKMDDSARLFFGVFQDEEGFAGAPDSPPWRWFLDADGAIATQYGMRDAAGALAPGWVLLDPSQRILAIEPLARGAEMLARFTNLPKPDEHAGVPLHAPVLIVPRVFEPEFCRELIDFYEGQGGEVSGVMRTVEGRTVGFVDDFKRRRDAALPEGPLMEQVRRRLLRRLLPEIEKAYSFKATRVERWMVACYSAEEGGYFRAHRDNGSPGTAHRKFACSINLNDDFEGGELVFPEYGWRPYRPPPGGAVVFGCAMLHEVMPVTRGVRYAYLPFFYDEEGAKIRQANQHLLDVKAATPAEAS
jgi:predicted 2-oxoglutarate/Fe(II)-dependent dioxygenase YbiX